MKVIGSKLTNVQFNRRNVIRTNAILTKVESPKIEMKIVFQESRLGSRFKRVTLQAWRAMRDAENDFLIFFRFWRLSVRQESRTPSLM